MDVFDWKKEDEIAGHTDAEFCRKFLTNNNNNDARKGAEGKSEMKGFTNLTLNVDTIHNRDDNGDSAALTALVDGEDCAAKRTSVIDDILQNGSDVGRKFLQFGQDEVETRSSCSQMERSSSPEAASPATRKFSCSQLDSSPSDESIDANESWSEISESTSDSAEDDVSLDGRSANLCFRNWKMVDPDSVIECHPDYIEFRDKSLTDSVVTFSASWIKIKSSVACGEYGTFVFQWGIVDVIKIESHWHERLKLAEVKIHIIKGAVPNEDTNGSSVIEELKFAIGDDWYEKQDAIRSLDVYKPLWYTVQDDNNVAALLKSDANALLGQDGVLCKSYFPSFNEAFEDVIYPKGDPDAVSISKRDVDLLQPDTFVNDTIIDFYIKYLKIKIEPSERHKFHFFNSFFFRKLADLDKNPSSALEGRAAFQRVHKWTRKIDMFEKDYVFIPVNFNYHWSLILICYPGDVAEFRDACPMKSPKVPCILHMDSIRGSHSGLKGLLQSYLCEEWKERHKDTPEDISSKFLNLRFVSLELPQQQNSYDCGLFLLHYVELFLKDVPLTFNPLKITKSDKFLTVDWFQPSEASLKRTAIEKLIHELLESSHEDSTDVGSDKIKNCSSNCPKSLDESGYNIGFLSGTRSPTQALYGNLPSSQAGNGIELTLLPTPSMKSFQCATDSGLVLKQLLNPVASVGSFYQDFEQAGPFDAYENATPQTQGEQESSMQFEYSPSAENMLEQLSTEFGGQPSWSPGSTIKQKEQDIVDSLPEASIYDDSLEVKEVNDSTVGINLSLEVKGEQPRSPLTDNIEGFGDCLGPVSSEFLNPNARNNLDQMFDGTENAEPVTPCPEDLLGLSPQQSDAQENGNETREVEQTFCDDSVSEPDVEHAIKRRIDVEENRNETCEGEQKFHDNSVSESDVEHATKKRRVTPPEDEGEPTKSLGVELHL